jgi:hypothetical protein
VKDGGETRWLKGKEKRQGEKRKTRIIIEAEKERDKKEFFVHGMTQMSNNLMHCFSASGWIIC